MRLFSITLIFLSACGSADSNSSIEFDPLRCAITFEKYAIIAKLNDNENLSKGLYARQIWYVDQIKKLPDAKRSHAEIERLAKEADLAGENDLDTLKMCMEQQDMNPTYKEWKKNFGK